MTTCLSRTRGRRGEPQREREDESWRAVREREMNGRVRRWGAMEGSLGLGSKVLFSLVVGWIGGLVIVFFFLVK